MHCTCFTGNQSKVRNLKVPHPSHFFQNLISSVCGAATLLLLAGASEINGANIAWVSDASPAGFSGPGVELTDGGFVKLLQSAGHNVIRFNGPDSQTTLLSGAEVDALNTNDLIIISRAANSAAWQTPQGPQWNTAITKPLICMSPFLVRSTGTRMSWFNGAEGVDDTPVPWAPSPANITHPVVDYIFGTVAMNGTNTAELMTEPMDRNTTHIASAPVSGALIISGATFPRESDQAIIANGHAIVLFPQGTIAGGNALAGPRMFFAAGSRESATAPNAIPLTTGRETLTAAGEKVYLRSIEVMLANGVAPSTNEGPATITTQPVSMTVVEGAAATFSIAAGGAAPRLIEWQRSDGSGGFTNIPGAYSEFANGAYTLPAVTMEDNGSQFRAVASNSLDIVTSAIATLTVTEDDTPLVLEWATSISGSDIVASFNNLLEPGPAMEFFNYFTDVSGIDVIGAELRPDGRSVKLTLSATMGASLNLTADALVDVNGHALGTQTVNVRNLGLTGFDIGALNPAPGSETPAGQGVIAVTAGGLDMASTADIMRFVSQPVAGDFDARVRVTGIAGTFDHLEAVAKAALVARESTAPNAASVIVFATPPAPGEERAFAHYRSATGGATNLFGPSVPLKTPDAWLRIQRAGDEFTTYHSTNGIDWVTFGTATIALSPNLEIGLGAVSHRNGKTVTATFSNLRVGGGPLDPVTLVNPVRTQNDFQMSFPTVNGATYTVEYKEDLNSITWTSTPSIAGDGTVKTFTDPSPGASQRFYRVRAE